MIFTLQNDDSRSPGQKARSMAQDFTTLTPRARRILALVRRHSGATRSQLIRDTGLSGTAIFRATEELEARGLVVAGAAVAAGPGQPSASIHIVPGAAFSVGLSIMTDQADVVLIDLAGAVRMHRDVTVPGMDRAAILDAVDAFIAEACRTGDIDRRAILGIGVAISGFFVGPAMVNSGSELDDWSLIDLEAAVSRRLALPAIIENIASASALGERLLGAGADSPSFAYLNVATGFGAGIVIRGELARGEHGNAGEIGILYELSGRETPNLTTLRALAAAQGETFASIRELVARYDDNWPWLDEWVSAHAPSFSFMAGVMRYVIDCEAVILGGRLPRALAARVIAAMHWPEQLAPARRDRPAAAPRLIVAELSAEQSAMLGAATLPLMRQHFA